MGDAQKMFINCLKLLLSNRPITTVVEVFLQEVCKLTHSKHGLMGQRMTNNGEVYFRYYGVYGMPQGFQYHKLYEDQGYIDDRAHNMLVDFIGGKPIFRNSYKRETPYPAGHPNIDNCVFYPLHDINNKIIGVLSLAGEHEYTPETMVQYEYLIEMSSVFLQILLERMTLVISRDNFLANISHEIRTPLSGIMCINRIMTHTELPVNVRHHMNIIETCCTQLLNITNDILDYTHIRSGNMQLKNEEISLREILKTINILVKDKVQPGVQLFFDISDHVPDKLIGDQTRIIQTLINVVDNSSKFTKKGHIRISVDLNSQRNEKGYYTISFQIEDTGCGIEPERMEHIFDMVNNFNPSYLSSQCGVGLGLPIAKHIVEMYHGTININSVVGKGTTVKFTLNLEGLDILEEIRKMYSGADVLIHISDSKLRNDIFDTLLNIGARPLVAPDNNSLERYIGKHKINFNFKLIVSDIAVRVPSEIMVLNPNATDKEQNDIMKMLMPHQKNQEPSVAIVNKDHRSSYRILIAEDDPQNMTVFVMLLVTMGYSKSNIHEVTNGAELYVALTNQSVDYDIAFVDLKMPVMDGISAIKQYNTYISANPESIIAKRRKKMLILAVTASISAQTRQACFDVKMNGYIQKPIKIEDLEEIDVMIRALDIH